MSFRRTLMIVLLVLFLPGSPSYATLLNGDFSNGLDYWETEHVTSGYDFVSNTPAITVDPDEFIVMRTQGEDQDIVTVTLFREVQMPEWAYTLSFDISYSWGVEGSLDPDSGQFGYPDFFQASWFDNDPDFDRSFIGIDPIGPFDPETFTDITLVALGDDWFRFIANIEDLRGHQGMLYFDLFDDLNGQYNEVKLDNVHINPIPEPATFLLLGIGLAGLCGALRRKNEN